MNSGLWFWNWSDATTPGPEAIKRRRLHYRGSFLQQVKSSTTSKIFSGKVIRSLPTSSECKDKKGGANLFGKSGATMQQAHPSDASPRLKSLPAWKALETHYSGVQNLTLRQLFAEDSERGQRFAVEAAGL